MPRFAFRGDIEGVRTVAVAAVLLYHARVPGFGGGYVGVDVFFAVSGFLITSILLREGESSGTISLPAFWARRIRRLVPASILVVVATMVVARWALDPLTQRSVDQDGLLAALGVVINTVFAFREVDYLHGATAGPFQHYWSLALEETFYLVWPVVAWALLRRGRVVLGAVAAAGTAASFALCLAWTSSPGAPLAFFLLPARAWELLVGAVAAVWAPRLARLPRAVGWAGLAAVGVAVLGFDDRTLFPGWAAALPVLGTIAVLLAPQGPGRLLDTHPMRWWGARSYSIYLWHWPVVVLAEARFGPFRWPERMLMTAASVVAAIASFRFVEQPLREHAWFRARPARTYALGALLVADGLLVGVALQAVQPRLDGGVAAAAPAPSIAAPGPAPGRATTDPTASPPDDPDQAGAATTGPAVPQTTASIGAGPAETTAPVPEAPTPSPSAAEQARQAMAGAVTTQEVPANLRPSLRDAGADRPVIYGDGCLLDPGRTTGPDCIYGDRTAATAVALVGDSHAAHWFPAFEAAATARGWRLIVLAKKGCPAIPFPTYDEHGAERVECGPWREGVAQRLAGEHPDLIVLASYRYRLVQEPPPAHDVEVWRGALDTALIDASVLAARVLVLGDTPNPVGDVPTCLARHLSDVPTCTRSREAAEHPQITAIEREVAALHGAAYASPSDWLCTDATCPVVVGDLLLYRDDNHLTATAAEWLAPVIAEVLDAVLA